MQLLDYKKLKEKREGSKENARGCSTHYIGSLVLGDPLFFNS